MVNWRLANLEDGINDNLKALKLRQELLKDNDIDAAVIYNTLGILNNNLGDYEKAESYHKKALEIRIKVLGLDHQTTSTSFLNLGVVYKNLGDYGRALEYYKKDINTCQKNLGKDHIYVSDGMTNVGNVYYLMKDYNNAYLYYQKALSIFKKQKELDKLGVSDLYNNIGLVCVHKKQFKKALENLNLGLTYRLELKGEYYTLVANSYRNLAFAYSEMKNHDKAIEYYKKTIRIYDSTLGKKNPNSAIAYNEIGTIHLNKNELSEAIQSFQNALCSMIPNFNENDYNVNPELENLKLDIQLFKILYNKGKALASDTNPNSNFTLTYNTFELASKLIDKIRISYKSQTSKFFLGSQARDFYSSFISICSELYKKTQDTSYLEKIFENIEKCKSIVLLESINEIFAKNNAGIPDSILTIEKELRTKLIFYEKSLDIESNKTDNDEKIKELQNKMFETNLKYQTLIEDLEKNFPQYYEIKYHSTITKSEDIQKYLDNKSIVIEYFINSNGLITYLIDKNKREIIETKINGNQTKLKNLASKLLSSIRKMHTTEFVESSKSLYDMLIKPIKKHLINKNRIIIIPDDVLFNLPFETLISSDNKIRDSINFSGLNYLIKNYSITYNYSASLLMNSLMQSHTFTNRLDKLSFVGFAPMVEKSEPLSEKLKIREDKSSDNVELKFSQEEIKSIQELFIKNGLRNKIFLGRRATKNSFIEALNNFNIIHIATHSYIDEKQPNLSRITFSRRIENVYDPESNLYCGEIYGLKLEAHLITLSSCESGLGKYVKGEGLMTFTRGFIYAGARNIIVSLWKVYDEFSAILMNEFYKNLLQGKSIDQAIRQAKLKMINDEDTASPLKWSAFIHLGFN
ncbi:MAG: CHAT domain-containing protein [Ignavibacteria bacterium]|nr:CHAT domain-containing protein [Ignavibacteria bacterium]